MTTSKDGQKGREGIVRNLNDSEPIDCPYGHVRRVLTGGESAGNVHVVSVTRGSRHRHEGYDETYYVLNGTGTVTLDEDTYDIGPGSVVYIPRGLPHELNSNSDEPIEFIIFGTPGMNIQDAAARPLAD